MYSLHFQKLNLYTLYIYVSHPFYFSVLNSPLYHRTPYSLQAFRVDWPIASGEHPLISPTRAATSYRYCGWPYLAPDGGKYRVALQQEFVGHESLYPVPLLGWKALDSQAKPKRRWGSGLPTKSGPPAKLWRWTLRWALSPLFAITFRTRVSAGSLSGARLNVQRINLLYNRALVLEFIDSVYLY